MVDLQIAYGGIAFVTAISARGSAWVAEHVDFESWQVQGGSLACEPAYAEDIASGAEDAGLRVEYA